jgi:hypothetical protein
VEFRSRDDFGQLFHVCGLDIHNVEALVLYVEIPQIDSQIITADECLPITVYRNAVYVVSVGVCIRSSGHGGDDGVVVCHAWQLQCRGIFE